MRFVALLLSMLPSVASAATNKGLYEVGGTILDILPSIIQVIMFIATLVFLYGIVLYVSAAGSEEKIKEGRTYMIWGIVGLFIMIAVWGFARVLINTFDLESQDVPLGPGEAAG